MIHTAVNLQYDLGSGLETVANYDIYLPPGVGMIETDNVVEGQPLNDVTIKSYTIK